MNVSKPFRSFEHQQTRSPMSVGAIFAEPGLGPSRIYIYIYILRLTGSIVRPIETFRTILVEPKVNGCFVSELLGCQLERDPNVHSERANSKGRE